MVNQSLNIPQMIGARIKKKDPGAEVILFGSHARGEANEEFNDVLVNLIKKTIRQLNDIIMDILYSASKKTTFLRFAKTNKAHRQLHTIHIVDLETV